MSKNEDGFQVSIGFHQGRVMGRLAGNYGNLGAAIDEVNQNGIDAGATQILNVINLKRGFFRVFDNGTGASREKIAQALDTIGATMKTADKFGRFGLGLIAPLSVVDEFTLTTCPDARLGNFTAYRFTTRTIVAQKSVAIPAEPVPDLRYDPNGKMWWRTEVYARGLTKDQRKTAATAAGIAESLSLKFGEAILERSIKITVDFTDRNGENTIVEVQPREFTGEALDKFTASREDCGNVEVTLFIARLGRGGRKGEVTFGTFDNPSRLTAKQFNACTQGLLKSAVARALLSGVFEGVVRGEKILLHENRTKFEDNDALLAFCDALEEWFDKKGNAVLQQTAEDDADDRFQKIGTEVMPFAELLLKQKDFEAVAARINIGTVGTGHAKVPKKLIIGPDSGTSLATGGQPFAEKPSDGKAGDGEGKPAKTEIPGHHPGIVYGVKGRNRTRVRGNSTGLGFEYVELEDFRIPFLFEPESGILSFNKTNPNFGRCQENDEFLRQYLVNLVTVALSLETFRDANGHISEELTHFAHESVTHQAFAVINRDALVGFPGFTKGK